MRYKRNVKEIEAYYEYTLRIESINNEMRKFRHDYVNILHTLSDYIREMICLDYVNILMKISFQ